MLTTVPADQRGPRPKLSANTASQTWYEGVSLGRVLGHADLLFVVDARSAVPV